MMSCNAVANPEALKLKVLFHLARAGQLRLLWIFLEVLVIGICSELLSYQMAWTCRILRDLERYPLSVLSRTSTYGLNASLGIGQASHKSSFRYDPGSSLSLRDFPMFLVVASRYKR
ncbi:hypothetical protein SISNIDRAFT_470309 [Sistotremastrum niveocremeum HHB9708]|uniref:Uncharacterized protein n=1 Tax=Sistotremastrum niveocremeum HHB9708 TaxID=1314777 RepID=A0A164P3B2_9AGAM|nr:hypothetical protein SISNIDRAFT_470309 [Sistotremastrum niveocremeum HHB9708]